MIVSRRWTNDLYAFFCAEEMDRAGIRVVAVFTLPGSKFIHVWGQGDAIDFDALDKAVDRRIDASGPDGGQSDRHSARGV